jgi:hypothetical protein
MRHVVIPTKTIIMNKIALLTFLILFLISSTAFAQVDNYGLKIGAQSTGAYSDPYDFNRNIGFGIYGFADVKLSPKFFSTLNLGYTQRGYTDSQIETDQMGQKIQTVEATSRLSYISLSGVVNTNLSTTFPFYIGAGPRFDYLINTSPGKYEFSSVTAEDDVAKSLSNFVLGGSLVTGIRDISIIDTEFRVEVKYEIDVTDSLRGGPATFRNNALMFAIGFNL